MVSTLLQVCIVAVAISTAIGKLPSYIEPCKRKDPELGACITRAIEGLREKLASGIPELDAPAIEPLKLQQIRLVRGPAGARLDVNISDLVVSGPSAFRVSDLKADLTRGVVFTFKVSFKSLHFQGKYAINTRILLLRLSGSGDITGSFSNYTSNVILRAQKVRRDEKDYLNFEPMKIALKIGGTNIHLSNLFNGDPILGPASNQVLNAHSDLFVEEIKPVLETTLSDLFTDVANKITRSFTYDELFPNN